MLTVHSFIFSHFHFFSLHNVPGVLLVLLMIIAGSGVGFYCASSSLSQTNMQTMFCTVTGMLKDENYLVLSEFPHE